VLRQTYGYLPSRRASLVWCWRGYLVPNYTARRQRHMCVNNLPKVVTWKRNGRESNPRSFQSSAQCSAHYATRPPGASQKGGWRGRQMPHYYYFSQIWIFMPSVLWHCWLSVSKSIRPVKNECWGVGVVICLERGAYCFHMVHLVPLLPHLNPDWGRGPCLAGDVRAGMFSFVSASSILLFGRIRW